MKESLNGFVDSSILFLMLYLQKLDQMAIHWLDGYMIYQSGERFWSNVWHLVGKRLCKFWEFRICFMISDSILKWFGERTCKAASRNCVCGNYTKLLSFIVFTILIYGRWFYIWMFFYTWSRDHYKVFTLS
jgi:hypothetical protein